MAIVVCGINGITWQWLLAVVVFGSGAYFMKQKRWLTYTGSLSAFFVACILYQGGLMFFVMPFFLLIGGTLISKLNADEGEKNGRNAIQVLANGGVALLCLLGWYWYTDVSLKSVFLKAYLISFSISICDTFSSEVGKYLNGHTIDIFSLRKIQKGLSGGISIQGTIAGALSVGIACSLIPMCFGLSWTTAFYIAFAGFLGMVLDSILGSLLQATYISEDGQISETANPSAKLYKGFAWCTNDVVNVLSNAIVTGAFIVYVFILQ
ncbi:MAG: DUF92 domain-containing protein [Bacteroidota bacterium]